MKNISAHDTTPPVGSPADKWIQGVMWEVFEYAKAMDGFDSLEGEERTARRTLAHAQDAKLRRMLAAGLQGRLDVAERVTGSL